MKNIYKLISSVIFFSALILTVSAFNAKSSGTDSVALVMKIVKDVYFKSGASDWKEAKIGSALSSGNEIKTGKKSLAVVKFLDNSILKVKENSIVKVSSEKSGDKNIKDAYLEKGTLGFDVKKQNTNDEFKFSTPTMVASIRGTSGFIQILEDGTIIFALFSGEADLEALIGLKIKLRLQAGKYAQVNNDGNISEGDINQSIKEEGDKIDKTNVKQIIIKTSEGDLIIDYLVD